MSGIAKAFSGKGKPIASNKQLPKITKEERSIYKLLDANGYSLAPESSDSYASFEEEMRMLSPLKDFPSYSTTNSND